MSARTWSGWRAANSSPIKAPPLLPNTRAGSLPMAARSRWGPAGACHS